MTTIDHPAALAILIGLGIAFAGIRRLWHGWLEGEL
jgi:hypothetical protein